MLQLFFSTHASVYFIIFGGGLISVQGGIHSPRSFISNTCILLTNTDGLACTPPKRLSTPKHYTAWGEIKVGYLRANLKGKWWADSDQWL